MVSGCIVRVENEDLGIAVRQLGHSTRPILGLVVDWNGWKGTGFNIVPVLGLSVCTLDSLHSDTQ